MSSRLLARAVLAACFSLAAVPVLATVTYSGTEGVYSKIFNSNSQRRCLDCHSSALAAGSARSYAPTSINFDTYANATAWSSAYSLYTDQGANDRVYTYGTMPPSGPLTQAEKDLVHAWAIQRNGATPPPDTLAPDVATNGATGISKYAATLNASVNDNGATATYSFQYGTTTWYGSSTGNLYSGSTGGGLSSTPISTGIFGLSCSTTYHFRGYGYNSTGTTYGGDNSFTTSACPAVTGTTGSLVLNENQSFSITVNTSGGVTSFQLIGAPSGMSISAGGLISWPAASIPKWPTTNTNYPFTVRVGDGVTTSDYAMSVTVTTVNDPPSITSFPVTTANESTAYTYNATATDIENNTLTWSLVMAPAGMAINPSSGQLTWTPPKAASNYTQNVTIAVTDNGTTWNGSTYAPDPKTVTQSFTITVYVNSNPPVITSSPSTTATEHKLYSYPVAATDPKGNPMTYSLTAYPAGMTINSSTGVVQWTPGELISTSGTVTVSVNDGFYTTTQSFVISVTQVNDPPVITSTPVTTATEHQLYSYQATATDPEISIETLTWSLVTAPPGMTINSSTGLIQWTPPEVVGQAPTISVNVTVKVTDNGVNPSNLSVTQSYTIVVTMVNDPPVITSTPVTTARQYQPYSYQATAVDPENDTLTWSLVTAPAGMTINSSTGLIQWTPPAGIAASANVTVKVTDNGVNPSNLSVTQSYTIAVTLVPVVTPGADVTVTATGYYTPVSLKKATAVDPVDGPLPATADNYGPFRPGTNTVTWSATNSSGTTGTATQKAIVKPLATLGGSEASAPGAVVIVPVRLSGNTPAPQNPVTLSYTVGGTATAGVDYQPLSGTATFSSGQVITSIPVTLINNGAQPDKTLVITLNGVTAGDAVLGSSAALAHTIRITTGPVPPTVSLRVSQNGVYRQVIYRNLGGPVLVDALISNATVGCGSWNTGSVVLLAPATGCTLNIDPSTPAGAYTVSVTTQPDANGTTVTRAITFLVVNNAPTLGTSDTDGDGLPDNVEGLVDANRNGLLDYLDATGTESPETIPMQLGKKSLLLMAVADSGLQMSAGGFAVAVQSPTQSGIQIFETQVANGATPILDPTYAAVGAIYDFEVSGLSPANRVAHVVLPLPVALLPGEVQWRELSTSQQWMNFVGTGSDGLSSASRMNGQCPPPQDPAYVPGLIAGNDCVQLTVTDGGPNDADVQVNGSVRVTAAPSVLRKQVTATAPASSQTGGSADIYTLVLLTMAAAMAMIRRKEQVR